MSGKRFIRISGIRVDPVGPTEEEFGRLTKIGRRFNIGASAFVVVECKCGDVLVARDGNVNRMLTESCGCLKREIAAKSHTVHGLTNSPEYVAWCCMKDRCTNPNIKNYADYGGRGITVCDRWLESFGAFYTDMGPKPTSRHSIDRFPDNNGNYSPQNCRWATPVEQCNNRRTNRILTINGVSHTVAEWSRISLVPGSEIRKRLSRGWPHHDAAMKPVRKRNN